MAKGGTKSDELKKLKKIFADIEPKKRDVVQPLIENAAFMSGELAKLSEYIKEHGCTEEYQNGEHQRGKKKSSEVEVYNTMIKNYTNIIKQLVDLLPDGATEEADELMQFLGGGKR